MTLRGTKTGLVGTFEALVDLAMGCAMTTGRVFSSTMGEGASLDLGAGLDRPVNRLNNAEKPPLDLTGWVFDCCVGTMGVDCMDRCGAGRGMTIVVLPSAKGHIRVKSGSLSICS